MTINGREFLDTTRSGLPYRVISTDIKSKTPIIIAVLREGEETCHALRDDGRGSYEFDCNADLIGVKPKHTRWGIVSPDWGYATKDAAVKAAAYVFDPCRTAAVHWGAVVAVTFEEGEGL